MRADLLPDFKTATSNDDLQEYRTDLMESIAEKAEALREHIAAAESELKALKEQLVKLKASARSSVDPETSLSNGQPPYQTGRWPLSAEEYKRYGRQMILSGIGIKGLVV